jgi:hypothetical protein
MFISKSYYRVREQIEEWCIEGGGLPKPGKSIKAEIARQQGVSRAAVCAWAKAIEAGGFNGYNNEKAQP